jgi:hypothetical protein
MRKNGTKEWKRIKKDGFSQSSPSLSILSQILFYNYKTHIG